MVILTTGLVHAQPSLALHPPVITDCNAAGLGQTTVQWSNSGSGKVQILVGAARTPFTGFVSPSGSAFDRRLGERWAGIPELADAAGNQLRQCDRAGAKVQSIRRPRRRRAGCRELPSPRYREPLDLPDTSSRFAPTSYTQWLVTAAQIVNGQLWFVIQVSSSDAQSNTAQMLMRQGDGGRIYQLTNGQSQLWLDPNTPQDPTAQLQVSGRGPQENALGTFADGLNYTKSQSLSLETGTIVRGLGLTSSSATVLAGSAGGFSQSLDLVEARIDGPPAFRGSVAVVAAFDRSRCL